MGISLYSSLGNNLIHDRIPTLGEVMSFPINSPNCWSFPLFHDKFPSMIDLPPLLPSDKHRILRVRQYWSSSKLYGDSGLVIEILEFTFPIYFFGRRRVPLISLEPWIPPILVSTHALWEKNYCFVRTNLGQAEMQGPLSDLSPMTSLFVNYAFISLDPKSDLLIRMKRTFV